MTERRFNVAIVGATGLVGEQLLRILECRNFPVDRLYPLASKRSIGATVPFRGRELAVLDLAEFDFRRAHIGLFSAGGSVSGDYAPKAAASGCVVIDNTSRFRYDAEIPLIVPEVNADALPLYRKRHIIANPNCSTIQMVVALYPLHVAACIKRVNVATYQAVSGSGRKGMQELSRQNEILAAGGHVDHEQCQVYDVQIAGNAIPHIDDFADDGFTREERKMAWETMKIMGSEIGVNATCVRIPVFRGHSEAVHLETRDRLTRAQAIRLLREAPGVKLMDGQARGYPTAATHAQGEDAVFVGRVREDPTHPNGLNLWVVSDNARKGAALNSVQIAELLAGHL